MGAARARWGVGHGQDGEVPDTRGVPDRDGGVLGRDGRFQTGDGIPDACGDSRHDVMGYETGDDEVSGSSRVTTLTSHQSGILHSLIFGFIWRWCRYLNTTYYHKIYLNFLHPVVVETQQSSLDCVCTLHTLCTLLY